MSGYYFGLNNFSKNHNVIRKLFLKTDIFVILKFVFHLPVDLSEFTAINSHSAG